MNKKTLLIAIMLAAPVAASANVGVGQSGATRAGTDITNDDKKDLNESVDVTRDNTKGVTTGTKTDEQQSLKDVLDFAQGKTATTEMTYAAIVLPVLKNLERAGVMPFARCNLLSQPLNLERVFNADIFSQGKAGRTTNKMVYRILEEDAKGSDYVRNLDGTKNKEVERLASCFYYYGIVGQAAVEELAKGEFGAFWKKQGGEKVRMDIPLKDYQAALKTKVVDVATSPAKISDLKAFKREVMESGCRFPGAVTDIRCGELVYTFNGYPAAKYNTVPWLDETHLAGYSSKMTIDTKNSLSAVLDKLKSVSKYKDVSSALQQKLSQGIASGRVASATVAVKAALEQDVTNKAEFDVGRIIPLGK